MQLPFQELEVQTNSATGPWPEDSCVHGWYNFVLAFPPHLVREYLHRFGVTPRNCVLDPFSGTGTTLVECKKNEIPSVGIEALPMSHFASRVKTDWSPLPDALLRHCEEIAAGAHEALGELADGDPASLRSLSHAQERLLIKGSISPLPLHKTLLLMDAIQEHFDERYWDHEMLALASVLPTKIGNLRFGPEVGVGKRKLDSPVVDLWLSEIQVMAQDLRRVRSLGDASCTVWCGDAREPMAVLEPGSIDAVITSPPYPNEKDYTRIVRLESVLLGFMADRAELRTTKESLLRSNTRNVYKDDDDDVLVADRESIQRIAEAIERRRVELGKTSGFERAYARAVLLYFGGMKRHLAGLRDALRPEARLAYVVGDQASYLRVMIRTGQLLGEIAESLGYEVEAIDLFRTRIATATGERLREEVLVLRWPG